MCGIFTFLTKNPGVLSRIENSSGLHSLLQTLEHAFMEGKNRGPEASKFITSNDIRVEELSSPSVSSEVTYDTRNVFWYAGFHRLAINGLTEAGMQPFVKDGVVLLCNGEIYNYKELYRDIGITDRSSYGSDCQVILDYYLKYGIDYTVSKLHGVFAFVIIDSRLDYGKMFIVRDRLGIRSLYWACADATLNSRSQVKSNYGKSYAIASELKQISAVSRRDGHNLANPVYTMSTPLLIEQFPAGHIATVDMMSGENTIRQYWSTREHVSYPDTLSRNYKQDLVESLFSAVKVRVDACERELCCLLSGGLDSSLIASMVSRILRERGDKLKTFSIGMTGSQDLKYAREVADFIGSDHSEVTVTSDAMINAMSEVVKAIETYDTTTVRASVGNYLVCKYIKENCDAKVVFNGDGADEVMGGYLYFQVIKEHNTHENERLRLLDEICHYDVLRSDKSIAGNGLEARTPYLDPSFIRTYFAASYRHHQETGRMPAFEKELIRTAVDEYGKLPDSQAYRYLPNCVLYRRKEAFSDGVSGETKSWKDEIEEKLVSIGIDKCDRVISFMNDNDGRMTLEQCCYKSLFYDTLLSPYRLWFNDIERSFYERLQTRWMPRFVEATDPSARTLEIYNAGQDQTVM